jgi:iron-sulfur cluster repair protein YtfE (RIC family)
MPTTTLVDFDVKLLNKLEADHRKVEKLFKQLDKAEEASVQRRLVGELTNALAEHMRLEETQVYPALSRLDGEMGEEAEIEHGLARDGLATLTSMIGMPGFGAAVAMLEAGISHHVEEEEKEAFPKLRKAAGVTAKKAPAKKAAATKKPAAKKPVAKKPVAKKPATKKSATKKSAAKAAPARRR